MPYARYPRAYKALAAVAIFGSVCYAYSLRLMDYNGNRIMVATGTSVQELVPVNGSLFYFIGADYVNPEYLYYARRRGVLSHIDQADNEFVSKTIKEHRWDPGEIYVLANAIKSSPLQQEKLKARLDKYDLKEIGNSIDRGIVYKLTPKN